MRLVVAGPLVEDVHLPVGDGTGLEGGHSALDTEDVVSGTYNLNVSSPGADRPLTLPRQYAKHVGRRLGVEILLMTGEPMEVLPAILSALP